MALELYLERGIRDFKVVVHGHVSKGPEKVYANSVTLQHATSEILQKRPHMAGLRKLVRPDITQVLRHGGQYDDGSNLAQLLGSGTLPRAADRARLVGMLKMYLKQQNAEGHEPPGGWEAADEAAIDELVEAAWEAKCIRTYTMADLRAEEIIKREAEFHSNSRQNCWVLVRWTTGDEEEKPYVCVVNTLLRVTHPTNTGDVLRLAGLRVYAPQSMQEGMYIAKGGQLAPPVADSSCYPVCLDSIDCKLVVANDQGDFTATAAGTMYCMPFFNVSKSY
jgi:hypothetical protein